MFYAEPALTSAQQNSLALYDMVQIMRHDPRRRFVFGLSLDITAVRLWYMNRSITIVSEQFHLGKDHHILAEVCARLSFATLSQLGYDHTIQRLPYDLPDRSPSYRIEVGAEAYITTSLLADHAAHHVHGRCTRVFSPYKEDDPEKKVIYAIKDNWLEAGHSLELDVYNDIIASIREHDWSQYTAPPKRHDDLDGPRWQQPELKIPIESRHGEAGLDRIRFFVPILEGTRVSVEDGRDDDTISVMLGGYQIPPEGPGLRFGADGLQTGRNKTIARAHHRTVMRLGTSLNNIKSASRASGVLADAAYGLFVLHQVGYCHQDVSPYNILELDGRGVLADFEFVTHSSDLQARRDARTGTANLMAVEVMLGAHIVPKQAHAKYAALLREIAKNPQKAAQRSDPWAFSPVHDLESVWWIALWLLCRHTAKPPPTQSEYQAEDHKSFYLQLFPGTMDSGQRQRFLTAEYDLARLFTALPPDWTERLYYGVLVSRNELMLAYQERQSFENFEKTNPMLWYAVEGILCEAGRELAGEFVPFAF